ncbi:hypothetical protein CMV_025833 [Castanea mollissima]|uniref:Uncharacterized protein n=1 Tax=Castanea mollissima TaxID=60419 RepID=A0A8J4Q8S1_9ROSI|nr:hypothetical protein CMV_025833 [Castanea mollissima]
MSHIRHLSFLSNVWTTPTIPLSRDGMGRLRTVFWICPNLGDKLLDLKFVRGLTLSRMGERKLKKLLKSICEFRHLRLLRIKDAVIYALPNSITKLYNLQTLVVKNSLLFKLPKNLRNLINLRHINIGRVYEQMPINMGQLTCLQTLPFFVIGQKTGHRIEELGYLSQLNGGLNIFNLEHVRDKEEAKTANLVGKTRLHKLEFHWSDERVGNNNDEDVLEGLQPHPLLKSLKIENFRGEKFPLWILAGDNSGGGLFLFNHLLEVRLVDCNKCQKIPTLGHLPCLKFLQIEGMNNVTCIGAEFYDSYSGVGSSTSRGGSGRNALFPALERLDLQRMPNLVEWKDTMDPTTTRMVFPRLEDLTIKQCEKLKSAPCHFPSLKKLDIIKTCGTTFKNIISKLTTLVSLDMDCISELDCLPEHLWQNNTMSLMSLNIWDCADLVSILLPHEDDVCAPRISLQSLYIRGCNKLSHLPNTLQTLNSLEKFRVFDCPNVMYFPSLQGVAPLRTLRISCGVEVFPSGLQSCTSLSELNISICPNLKLIPDMPELHSLIRLDIWDCPNLISIGDLRGLHSLIQLDICDFPNLISIGDLRGLHSLTRLEIARCPKLGHLPDGLDCLTRLKYLEIGGLCEELDVSTILCSIQHQHLQTSLEELVLYGCDKLNTPPDEILRFTGLKRLALQGCPSKRTFYKWLKRRMPHLEVSFGSDDGEMSSRKRKAGLKTCIQKDLPREKSPNGPRFSTFNKNRKLCRPNDSILKFTQYHTNPLIFIQAISSKEETSVNKAYTRKRFWKWHSRRQKYSKPSLIWSGKSRKHAKIPSFHDLEQNTDAKFLHICANETIQGMEYKDYPSPKNGILVADMSSNFSSKPVDVSKFGFIYVGAQKNVGPSRVTIVIIKKDLIGNDGIYMCGLAYEDLLDQGGLVEVEKKNKKKAEILYNAYNGSIGFYRCLGEKSVRSLMNVPFTLEKLGLEIEFIKEAAMENMVQLKWHKSVGVCVLPYTMEDHSRFHDLEDRMIEDKDKEISKLLDDNKDLHQSLESKPPVRFLLLSS